MKKIITISREFGAGGSAIGTEVARRLNYEFYDKAIILHAAREANLDVSSIMKWDEKAPGSFRFAQNLFDFYNKPFNEKTYETQKELIRKIGEKGKCVILGRNANTILKEYDSCLHVFVHANRHWRLVHMKEQMPDVSEAKLSEEMRSIDKARKRYCSYYTNTEFGSADAYDICLSSSSLGIEACVDLICRIAQMP